MLVGDKHAFLSKLINWTKTFQQSTYPYNLLSDFFIRILDDFISQVGCLFVGFVCQVKWKQIAWYNYVSRILKDRISLSSFWPVSIIWIFIFKKWLFYLKHKQCCDFYSVAHNVKILKYWLSFPPNLLLNWIISYILLLLWWCRDRAQWGFYGPGACERWEGFGLWSLCYFKWEYFQGISQE